MKVVYKGKEKVVTLREIKIKGAQPKSGEG